MYEQPNWTKYWRRIPLHKRAVSDSRGKWAIRSSPCDSPLLQRNHPSSDVMVRNLGLVQWDTRRGKTNRHSRNNSTSNEHSTVRRGRLEDGTDNPNPGRGHDSEPPSHDVCQLGDQESSKEGARGHGCDNGTLGIGSWITERPFVCVILEERWAVSGWPVGRDEGTRTLKTPDMDEMSRPNRPPPMHANEPTRY